MREHLEADYEALRLGRLTEVIRRQERMVEVAEGFADMLNAADAKLLSSEERDQIVAIETLSQENAILFEAVMAGVARVQAAMQRDGSVISVGAYDERGRPTQFRRATGGFAENV